MGESQLADCSSSSGDVDLIRAALKRAKRIARMYHRGGLQPLGLACKDALEALDRLEKRLKKEPQSPLISKDEGGSQRKEEDPPVAEGDRPDNSTLFKKE